MSESHPVVIASRYRLVRLIGQGGMGRVWVALDELLDRKVAIKEIVPPGGLAGAELEAARERAIREARAIARLTEPNVVRIFDVVFAGADPWIVMEFVKSRSLETIVRTDGPMPPERVAQIGLGVLAALQAAHSQGIVHRDVKPANVLIASDGRVVLTDFGLAMTAEDSSMTSTGVVLGSPSYLAPERALDQEVGPAADLWSLGATLYTAIEGRPPYEKSSPMATLTALALELPPPPRRAGPMRPVLAALLDKDPTRRIDAESVRPMLVAVAAGKAPAGPPARAVDGSATVPVPAATGAPDPITGARPAPTVGKPVPKPRRRGLVVTAVALLTVAGLASLSLLLVRRGDAAASVGQTARASAQPAPSASPHTPVTAASRSLAASRSAAGAAPSATTRGPTPAPTSAPATPLVGSSIRSMGTGTCLSAPATSSVIELWVCDGTGEQRFSFPPDGTLRVRGRCVSVSDTANGTRLRLATCTAAADQRFTYNDSYDLVSNGAGKCVDVPDADTSDGVPAQIWSCTGHRNQKWTYAGR